MNNLDFEKTQIWAKNLAANPAPPVASIPKSSLNFQKPAFSIKKPVLRPLTKEEKITIAAGGALAIGLGAIIITSLSDEDVEAATVAPSIASLDAPKLDLNAPGPTIQPTPSEPVHQTPAPPARPSSRPHEPAREHSKPDGLHALIEIPGTPEVATTPRDEQTFIDAFNTARKEIGPAGLFAWRDTYYSTFTDKEWESVADDKKSLWLNGAQPIIDPPVENAVPVAEQHVTEQQRVIVAERGAVTWTGIDADEDGQAEILMARINGQSPMVLMDTDGDGLLDTRYDYEASSGRTYASVIDPISMNASEIAQLEVVPVGPDMGFFNQSANSESSQSLPVSIVAYGESYVVSLDSNHDDTVDAITYLADDQGPIVGLDHDNDGQIETGYVYDSKSGTISFREAPLEDTTIGPPVYHLSSEATGQEAHDLPDLSDNEELSMNEEGDITDDFDSYFQNDPGLSDEYQNT
ncbi:hypothetical protein [Dyadobacter aurulentus]|uniref:hypothetical protein n=1 Tax=Dyadobacter sp. UC 10 TaxID=2605428 RepID=UPI0011F35C6D|nr:hypothetical protein [Dyadobacter sp. UC 10]KAA0989254.1 hypothetical protein FXO21_03305 [Dyadobacter sp. UC 10]